MAAKTKASRVVRIVVVDDHDVLRKGVTVLLENNGCKVVGEAANGREALAVVSKVEAECVVLDLSMPELNGLECARRLRKAKPSLRIVILTAYDGEQFRRDVFNAGVNAYVLKTDAGSRLVDAVKPRVPDDKRRLIPRSSIGPVERQVRLWIKEGLTPTQIADRLGVPSERATDLIWKVINFEIQSSRE